MAGFTFHVLYDNIRHEEARARQARAEFVEAYDSNRDGRVSGKELKSIPLSRSLEYLDAVFMDVPDRKLEIDVKPTMSRFERCDAVYRGNTLTLKSCAAYDLARNAKAYRKQHR